MRRASIKPAIQPDLHAYLGGILRELESPSIAINGACDHVHILFGLNPNASLAETIRTVKANSSKWMHHKFAGFSNFAWQTGYAAFSVSESRSALAFDYIQNQQEHHKTRSFMDEYIALLRLHNIQFDERFVMEQAEESELVATEPKSGIEPNAD